MEKDKDKFKDRQVNGFVFLRKGICYQYSYPSKTSLVVTNFAVKPFAFGKMLNELS